MGSPIRNQVIAGVTILAILVAGYFVYKSLSQGNSDGEINSGAISKGIAPTQPGPGDLDPEAAKARMAPFTIGNPANPFHGAVPKK
jgi:hypothetical protein